MDLIVRYWNNKTKLVEVRYWGPSFFEHATHQDLLKQINEITIELDQKNFIKFQWMDQT